MISSSVLKGLLQIGLTPDQFQAVVTVLTEGVTENGNNVKSYAAQKQAAYRARKAEREGNEKSNTVTGKVPSPAPKEINQTPNPSLQTDVAAGAEAIEPKKRVRKIRARITAEVEITQVSIDYAFSKAMDRQTMAVEWEKFRDHHISRGTMIADLPATWRTWVRNWAERFNSRSRDGPRGPTPPRNPYFAMIGKQDYDADSGDRHDGPTIEAEASFPRTRADDRDIS